MLIIGHRGCSYKGFNQNTIKSFSKVLDDGIFAFEFDVQKTIDNKLIVVHDLELNKVSSGEGLVCKSSAKYISSLYAKTTAIENSNDKIPFLEDVLNLCETYIPTVQMHLEIKSENTAIYVVEVLKEYFKIGKLSENNFIISSFHFKELEEIKKLLPKIKVAFLCGAVNKENFIKKTNIYEEEILAKLFSYSKEKFMLPKINEEDLLLEKFVDEKRKKLAIKYLKFTFKGDCYDENTWELTKKIGAYSINPWYKNVTIDFIKKAKDKGLKVYTYTINEEKDILNIINLGVDGFFTDYYKKAFHLVNSFNKKQI